MGRSPCCVKEGLNKGTWTTMEDRRLVEYVMRNGEGKWPNLPKEAGLKRGGKSCRLRWLNYLRPDIKRGNILPDEEDLIIRLHRLLGNRWSLIAGRLPGRTDNEIKNYWNTNLSKKLGSNKNNIKKQQQNSTQPPIEKDEESWMTDHKLNSGSHMINKDFTSSIAETEEKEDWWTLDDGKLDMDFNLDDLLNFTVCGGSDNSHVNIISGASSSNVNDQQNDSACLRPEHNSSLNGEIMDHHHEFCDFALLFEPGSRLPEDWILDGDVTNWQLLEHRIECLLKAGLTIK